MHARRETDLDHVYRLQCPACDVVTTPTLGGDLERQADEGGPVDVDCPACGRPGLEVVAP